MASITARLLSKLGFEPRADAVAREADIQARNGRAQQSLMRQQRSLLASLTGPDVSSWTSDSVHINADTSAGLAIVRARSRDAALNNGNAKRFLGMVHSNVLGPFGVRYQARVRTAGGALKTSINDSLESAWCAWGRRGNCDVSGRYSWRDVQRLLLRHIAVDGEVLVRFVVGRGVHRMQLQLLRADALAISMRVDLGGGRMIRQGVESDADGRVVAYHLRVEDPNAEIPGLRAHTTTRVSADDMLHLMLPEQLDQQRGVPWMAAALKRMYQLDDFSQAGLNKARESAKRGGWFTAAADATPPPPMQDGEDEQGKFQTLQDGTWEQLPVGLQATPFENEYPNIEYGQFIKDGLRGVANGLNVAYITLGNDLEAVNYSSGQLGLEGERTMWLELQQWVIESLVDPVHRRWLKYSMLAAPELATLAYDKLDAYADAARWQAHRWNPIDPLKTVEAQRSRIEALLTSPQRVIAEAGEDPDEILAELLEWQDKTAGLKVVTTSTATTATAPADPNNADPAAAAAAARRLTLIASRALEG